MFAIAWVAVSVVDTGLAVDVFGFFVSATSVKRVVWVSGKVFV